jgi:multimeric flavodoxin WrbA
LPQNIHVANLSPAMRKHLLIVYHSQTGNTQAMAEAVRRGADRVGEVETRLQRAFDSGLEDLLWADGLLLGTPENFGYMSGALKDFLDRTYYPARGKVDGLPYSVFISAGNDGSGALMNIQRIAKGYPLKPVCDPIIAKGALEPAALDCCEELGETMAMGVAWGIF